MYQTPGSQGEYKTPNRGMYQTPGSQGEYKTPNRGMYQTPGSNGEYKTPNRCMYQTPGSNGEYKTPNRGMYQTPGSQGEYKTPNRGMYQTPGSNGEYKTPNRGMYQTPGSQGEYKTPNRGMYQTPGSNGEYKTPNRGMYQTPGSNGEYKTPNRGMYQTPGSNGEYKTPNRGLQREAFRSHFLLFIADTVIMTGLLVCGIIGVIWMDGELYSTPPFYVASFVAATVVMAKATVGGCFSVQGLFVKEKPDEPETALVILHMVLSVISLLGYFVAIVVFGVSRVLESCASSNDTPGCSNHAQVYKALGAITLVLILISIALTCFGIYLFVRFGKEFGVSPYKKSRWRKDPPRSVSKTISVHHNEIQDDMKDFV